MGMTLTSFAGFNEFWMRSNIIGCFTDDTHQLFSVKCVVCEFCVSSQSRMMTLKQMLTVKYLQIVSTRNLKQKIKSKVHVCCVWKYFFYFQTLFNHKFDWIYTLIDITSIHTGKIITCIHKVHFISSVAKFCMHFYSYKYLQIPLPSVHLLKE